MNCFFSFLSLVISGEYRLDQLMSKSIQVKQPELETKRIALLQKESELLKKRQDLQEKLLLELSTSQGDILKNEVKTNLLNENNSI